MNFRLIFLLLIAAGIGMAQKPAPAVLPSQPSVLLPPELARVLTDYEKAWSTGDNAGLVALFTDDGFVLSPNYPMVRGRAAIARFYHGPGTPLSLRAVSFAVDGNVGYIIGAFASRPGEADRGKFTLTLRKNTAGKWLIHSDMDNGNVAR